MFAKNLIFHMLLQHSSFKNPYHDSVCLNASQGLHKVSSVLKGGTEYPIHVQKIVNGPMQQMTCESKHCESKSLVRMSGHSSYECPHLSAQYLTPASVAPLDSATLDWLIGLQRIDKEKKGISTQLQYRAVSSRKHSLEHGSRKSSFSSQSW